MAGYLQKYRTTSLQDLKNVNIDLSSFSEHDTIGFDGTTFIKKKGVQGATLEDLAGVSSTPPLNGQALVYNSTSMEYEPTAISVPASVMDLSNDQTADGIKTFLQPSVHNYGERTSGTIGGSIIGYGSAGLGTLTISKPDSLEAVGFGYDTGNMVINNGLTSGQTYIQQNGANKLELDNSGNLKLNNYTTEGFLKNDVNGNITSTANLSASHIDNDTFFVDNGDNTKKMKFEVSGITTGTTRTITTIDEDLTLLGVSNNQTIQNKTIDSADGNVFKAGGINFNLDTIIRSVGSGAGNACKIGTTLSTNQAIRTTGSTNISGENINTAWNKNFGTGAGDVLEGNTDITTADRLLSSTQTIAINSNDAVAGHVLTAIDNQNASWQAPSAPVNNINDLGDVNITAVADKNILYHDIGSGDWINGTPNDANICDTTSVQSISGAKTLTSSLLVETGTGTSSLTLRNSGSGVGEKSIFDQNGDLLAISNEHVGGQIKLRTGTAQDRITLRADGNIDVHNLSTGIVRAQGTAISSLLGSSLQVLRTNAGGTDIEFATISSGEVNTGSSIGGSSNVFKQKTGVNLEFRGLTAGAGISLVENSSFIQINNSATSQSLRGLNDTVITGKSDFPFLVPQWDAGQSAYILQTIFQQKELAEPNIDAFKFSERRRIKPFDNKNALDVLDVSPVEDAYNVKVFKKIPYVQSPEPLGDPTQNTIVNGTGWIFGSQPHYHFLTNNSGGNTDGGDYLLYSSGPNDIRFNYNYGKKIYSNAWEYRIWIASSNYPSFFEIYGSNIDAMADTAFTDNMPNDAVLLYSSARNQFYQQDGADQFYSTSRFFTTNVGVKTGFQYFYTKMTLTGTPMYLNWWKPYVYETEILEPIEENVDYTFAINPTTGIPEITLLTGTAEDYEVSYNCVNNFITNEITKKVIGPKSNFNPLVIEAGLSRVMTITDKVVICTANNQPVDITLPLITDPDMDGAEFTIKSAGGRSPANRIQVAIPVGWTLDGVVDDTFELTSNTAYLRVVYTGTAYYKVGFSNV